MAKPLNAKRFTSALVPLLISYVRALGKDPQVLEGKYLKLRAADGLAAPEVTLGELGALFTEAAALLKDPDFGLHCAQRLPRGAYGLMEFAIRSAPTGRIALEQLATYGVLINPLVRWHLETDGDELLFHHRAPRANGVGKQANVFTVARILQVAREMLGDDLTPTSAWFAHDEPGCSPELATFLGTNRVSFGRASSGLSFLTTRMERPPVDIDVELNNALEAHGRRVLEQCGALDDAYERTRAAVLSLLPTGKASLQSAAKKLHVTPRTLQRRLGEAESSFATLLAETRRGHAERLLIRDDASIDAIARATGYRDTAAFTRAFRTWTGITPGRFRDQMREATKS